MPHGEPGWCPKCNGIMNNHALGCEWAPNPPATEDQMKCYAALSAINPENPAAVAESIGELVEAAERIVANFNGGEKPQYRVTYSFVGYTPSKATLESAPVARLHELLAKIKGTPHDQ